MADTIYYTSRHTGREIDDAVDLANTLSVTVSGLQTDLEDEASARQSADESLQGQIRQKADASTTQASLNAKADKTSVYTKTEVDTKLNLKANTSDVYTKSETYTKTEVNNAIQRSEETMHDEITDLANDVENLTANDISTDVVIGGTPSRTAENALSALATRTANNATHLAATASFVGNLIGGQYRNSLDITYNGVTYDNIADLLNEILAGKAELGGSATQTFAALSLRLGDVVISATNDFLTVYDGSTNKRAGIPLNTQGGSTDNVTMATVSNVNNAITTQTPSLAFRELAVTMGAVWNASTGFFELNGLTDITEAQMRNIIRYTGNYRPHGDMNSALRGKNASGSLVGLRTNLCNHAYIFGTTGNSTTSMLYFANNNRQLEVVRLTAGNESSEQIWATTLQYAFNNCNKLQQIIGVINVGKITANGQLANSFTGCSALESVTIYSLGVSLSLSDSPNLTAASVASMVGQAKTDKELTVTLHDTAYTRAVADADVKAASQARPLVTILNATGDKKMGNGETYHKETIGGVETWVKDPVGSDGSEDSGTIN